MQFRLFVFIGLIAITACATGCPNSGANKSSEPVAIAISPEKVGADQTNDAPVADDAQTAIEEVDTEDAKADPDAELVASADTLEFPAIKGDPNLEGKWFALFGQHDLGIVDHSWVDGHNVEFRKNGQAFWYKVVNGAEVETMDSQWSMKGNQLRLSLSAARAVETGLASLAPMGIEPLGIGSDEEIGLAKGNMPGGNASAMNLLDVAMDIQLDHHYLVIRDGYSRLMVYGREASDDREIPAGLDGGWVGKASGDRQFEAQFMLKGQNLEAVIDRRSKEFTGEFTNGYFVGEMYGPTGRELVAFYYDDLGFLDGVLFGKPFRAVSMEYEFIKAPQNTEGL